MKQVEEEENPEIRTSNFLFVCIQQLKSCFISNIFRRCRFIFGPALSTQLLPTHTNWERMKDPDSTLQSHGRMIDVIFGYLDNQWLGTHFGTWRSNDGHISGFYTKNWMTTIILEKSHIKNTNMKNK